HDAISFDILPTETPGEHIQGDIMDLPMSYWEQFDLAICHPPCTDLAVSGARHFKSKLEKDPECQNRALAFVQYCMDLPIDKIAVENPVSIISTRIRKPDQIIQPYHFGDKAQKTTCLWLKGEFIISPSGKRISKWYSNATGKERSKTFPGIANAFAEQWGSL